LTIISVINTYTKYNLHSTAPYIEGKMSEYAKKQGKRPGGGNVRGMKCPGEMFCTRKQNVGL